MTQKIEYPEQATFYICKDSNDTVQAYGKLEPSQVVETIHPTLDLYLDEGEWEAKLLEGGIDLNEQEDLDNPLGDIEL